jgi:hypothetical protein
MDVALIPVIDNFTYPLCRSLFQSLCRSIFFILCLLQVLEGLTINAWDLGGHVAARQLWKKYSTMVGHYHIIIYASVTDIKLPHIFSLLIFCCY